MIPRYTRAEMAEIWSDESRFKIWLEVETLALEAMAEANLAPRQAAIAVRKKAKVSTTRILEIENQVHHDVIAFLSAVSESVGDEARFLHRGMTSNDLLDTTFAVQLTRSADLILEGINNLLVSIAKRAEEFKYTACVGRSHGIHAEPTTFGLKLAGWYAEILRQKNRLISAKNDVAVGKLSGPVGTYASLPPQIESYVLSRLDLAPETVATQVVARDRHASFFLALAQLGGSIERICVEIRHLQRTEVGEVFEPFGSQQKGSSAMPHKKNPILTENLTGLARLLRSYSITALENVPLWHERDISHSSAERVIAPDGCIIADFMLARLEKVISGMVVDSKRMADNLELTGGRVYSGTLLLALVDAGIMRDDAYKIVQDLALADDSEGNFKERAINDQQLISLLGKENVKKCFAIDPHIKYVDMIFERTFA
jgi:adenylosuccinate lyase